MNLKILHISKSDKGGAGIAALRLHNAMVSSGIDSRILFLQSSKKYNSTVTKFRDSIIKRILRATRLPFNEYIKNQKILKSRGGNYDSFSFIRTDYRVDRHPLIKDADIINLHFISGFIDYPSFFNAVNKPLFWTLHDKNPFMGGFHLSLDINSKNENLKDIDDQLKNEKIGIYRKHRNLNIIALNEHMLTSSKDSNHFSGRPHYLTRNTLDINTFKRYPKTDMRKQFSLDYEKKIFLFVSPYPDNFNKGYDILVHAIRKLAVKDLEFYRVGFTGKLNEKDAPIIGLGPVFDETALAKLYSAVDAVLIPSREENLPNVMLEALSCGTPVICTPTSGCKDIIRNFKNGLITPDFSSNSLAEALLCFLKSWNSFDNEQIRLQALKEFSPDVVVNKYIQAYGNCTH